MADAQILTITDRQVQTLQFPEETIIKFELVCVDGEITNKESIIQTIKEIEDYNCTNITCIGFICDIDMLDKALYLCKHIKLTTDWKTAWYNDSGKIPIDNAFKSLQWLDYIFMDDFNESDIFVRYKVNKVENGFELIKII